MPCQDTQVRKQSHAGDMTNSLPFQIPTKNIIQVKIILNWFSTQIIIDKFVLHLRG